MQIDSTQKIAGFPILQVRKLLKGFFSDYRSIEYPAICLGIDMLAAKRLMRELENLGYIEKFTPRGTKEIYYRSTVAGNALALASAAKPVSRATADRVFAEFILDAP